jgi:hypothetical protein
LNEVDKYIEYLLFKVVNKIDPDITKKNLWIQYKKLKSKLSSVQIINILNINNEYLNDFEKKWSSYSRNNLSSITKEVNSLRLIITLEYLFKNSKIQNQKKFPVINNSIELSIKQVRTLELILRDLIYEQIGNNNLLFEKLSSLFNEEQIKIWVKNADETGLLSGTSFSELTNIFINPNIFSSFENLFGMWSLKISTTTRKTLRFAFEDIRIIRNQIAHNKIVTPAQIELLNLYFLQLNSLLLNNDKVNLNLNSYAGYPGDNQVFLTKIQNDLRDYWASFLEYFKKTDPPFNVSKIIPKKYHWMTVHSTTNSFYEKENKVDFNLWLHPKKKLIGVELVIHNDLHKKVFDFLKQKEYSNSLKVINKNIEWKRMDDKKASRIMLKIEGDFLEKNDFEKQFIWFRVNLEKFFSVFNDHFDLNKL